MDEMTLDQFVEMVNDRQTEGVCERNPQGAIWKHGFVTVKLTNERGAMGSHLAIKTSNPPPDAVVGHSVMPVQIFLTEHSVGIVVDLIDRHTY